MNCEKLDSITDKEADDKETKKMIRGYEERKEILNLYEKARKTIKERIESAGVSCKGSAKGQALSEILNVLDDEMCIGLAEEMAKAQKAVRTYCQKFDEIQSLEREYNEKKQRLEEQQAVGSMVSLLTDEVLKNAVLAYNALKEGNGRYGRTEDAKDIVVAYIRSKGREDLTEVVTGRQELPNQ